MIKDISSIFFQQDPFCVVKTLLLLFECFQVCEGKIARANLSNMHTYYWYSRRFGIYHNESLKT